jgi:hypothetical protein
LFRRNIVPIKQMMREIPIFSQKLNLDKKRINSRLKGTPGLTWTSGTKSETAVKDAKREAYP